MTTPLDLAKKACLKQNKGVMDWRYCAEWLNLYAIEATKRLDDAQKFHTRPESKPGCYDGEAVE